MVGECHCLQGAYSEGRDTLRMITKEASGSAVPGGGKLLEQRMETIQPPSADERRGELDVRHSRGSSRLMACTLVAVLGAAAAWGAKDRGQGHRGGPYLAEEIGHQLRLLPYYSVFDNLEFRVEGY